MVEFLDISDELIILILAKIRKPFHILQFALANKRIHGIAIEHLYANVTFDHDDYHALIDARPSDEITPPHPHIQRLANMIRSNTLPSGQIVTSLNITVPDNHECNVLQTSLALLLPQLSSLKHLTLKSVPEDRICWTREQFSLAPLASALSERSQTLESLSLDFPYNAKSRDGWTIGSLRHFPKLKHLSAQGTVLLSEHALDSSQGCEAPDLHDVLPPGLKTLRLKWNWMNRMGNLENLHDVLEGFVRDSLRDRSSMKELVVHLDSGPRDQFDELKVGFLEANLETLNQKSWLGGLSLRMTLEWTQNDSWATAIPDGINNIMLRGGGSTIRMRP